MVNYCAAILQYVQGCGVNITHLFGSKILQRCGIESFDVRIHLKKFSFDVIPRALFYARVNFGLALFHSSAVLAKCQLMQIKEFIKVAFFQLANCFSVVYVRSLFFCRYGVA